MSGQKEEIERRTSKRKKCHLSTKLVTSDNLIITGHIIDINCYGVKVAITFKSIDKNPLVDKIFFDPNISLRMIEIGDKNPFRLEVALNIRHIYFNEGELYEMGFVLSLKEPQQQLWNAFYDKI